MMRFLLPVLAVLVFFWLLRRALAGRKTDRTSADRTSADDTTPNHGQNGAAVAPDLVACAHCGVLMPRGEALVGADAAAGASEPTPPAAGRLFCCEEHRRLGSA